MAKHSRVLLAASMALVLVTAGCSSADDPSATPSPTASTTIAPSASPAPSTAAGETTAPSATATTSTPTPALDQAPDPAETTAATGDANASATLTIAEFAFDVPQSVAPGATITVDNVDGVLHTVSADDDSFDLQVAASDSGTFMAPDEPGDHPFVCNLHANMSATLTVE